MSPSPHSASSTLTGVDVLMAQQFNVQHEDLEITVPAAQFGLVRAALADFDFDGDLDAFATIRGSFDQMTKIKVWRNNGDGTFAAPIEFPTGQGPAGIVIANGVPDPPAAAMDWFQFHYREIHPA